MNLISLCCEQNECRMFRVQFGGSSKEQMQEHCCSCVHKLSAYVPVQGADEHGQQLSQDTQAMDTEHAVSEHTHTQKQAPLAGRAGHDKFLTL